MEGVVGGDHWRLLGAVVLRFAWCSVDWSKSTPESGPSAPCTTILGILFTVARLGCSDHNEKWKRWGRA